jgi:hypothetical protein
MCFVFISEQTATSAPYNITWLVFITEMLSVYCAVGSEREVQTVCFLTATHWYTPWQAKLITQVSLNICTTPADSCGMFPSLFLSRITNFLARSQREFVRITPIDALCVMCVCTSVCWLENQPTEIFFFWLPTRICRWIQILVKFGLLRGLLVDRRLKERRAIPEQMWQNS